jgi:hypothetical protein
MLSVDQDVSEEYFASVFRFNPKDEGRKRRYPYVILLAITISNVRGEIALYLTPVCEQYLT